MNTHANHRTTDSFKHAVRDGRLRGPRSIDARATHAETVRAFLRAGLGHLLCGPVWRKAEIIRAYMNLAPAPTAEEWDDLDVRAQSFARFCRRNRVWVESVVEGAA